MNALTRSRQRYQRNLRFYADEPQLRLAAPHWHWYAKAFWRVSRYWLGRAMTRRLRCDSRRKKAGGGNRTPIVFVKIRAAADTLVKGKTRYQRRRTMGRF